MSGNGFFEQLEPSVAETNRTTPPARVTSAANPDDSNSQSSGWAPNMSTRTSVMDVFLSVGCAGRHRCGKSALHSMAAPKSDPSAGGGGGGGAGGGGGGGAGARGTPMAIRTAADRVVSYGAPVLPGAMFMLAYKGNVPIVGLPGCVMYAKRTIFDLILPRLMANDPVTSDEIASLGEGGLCLGCKVCVFPNCGFGK